MRMIFFMCALFSIFATNGAYADQIKDVDQWAKEFTDAAGQTDTGHMTQLIRSYAIPTLNMQFLEDNDPKIHAFVDGKKVVMTEQFENAQLGHFMRRINVAVIYEDRRVFYCVWFMLGADGWVIYHYLSTAVPSEVFRVAWP